MVEVVVVAKMAVKVTSKEGDRTSGLANQRSGLPITLLMIWY